MNLEIIRFKLLKLSEVYKRQGLSASIYFLWSKLKKKIQHRLFYKTLQQTNSLSEAQQKKIKQEIEQFKLKPLISVIMPVHNVDEKWLVKAIESITNQFYPYWELCIANDASTKEHIKPLLEKYATSDARIKVIHRAESGNISAASNSAIELATGSHIALLDNDDEYTLDALYEIAKVINQYPDAGIIYSDEDKIDEKDKPFDPWFKPDWSPEYLLTHMYVCHLGVYKTDLVRSVGGFRSEFDGAQDYDLCLRVSEKTNSIHHIPKILYHWRTIATSTAGNPNAKPHAYEAGRKTVEEHLHRKYGQGSVALTPYHGVYKTTLPIINSPLVSIIIPSAGKHATINGKEMCLLVNCIKNIREKSTYKNIEIIVVDGLDISSEIINECAKYDVQFLHCTQPFNFSQRINIGTDKAKGDYFLLLNDDTEVITPDWIEQLLMFAQQKEIGAVGAKLITEKNQVQHAGVILIEGSPGHIYYGIPDVGQGYFNALCGYRNYLAVTGACLMVSKQKFYAAGKLDEYFPVNYNDVDFCLALHKQGLRNVFSAHVVLYHYESVSRGKGYKAEELAKFIVKWENYRPAIHDPYYNPTFIQYPQILI